MGKAIVSATEAVGVEWKKWIGKLFVVEPLEYEKDVKTVHGLSDAVRANVFVLTGPGTAEEFEDTLIFPKVLQSQTRRKIGSLVVGRLAQGEMKPGQNAPWILAEATPADIKKASDYIASRSVSSAAPAEEEYEDGDEAF